MKQSPAFPEYDKDKQAKIPLNARLFPFRNLSGGLFSSFIIRFGPIQISQTASSVSYQSIRLFPLDPWLAYMHASTYANWPHCAF